MWFLYYVIFSFAEQFELFLEKFKTQVDEIEDLWKDLVPTDDSYNLADSSLPAMDFSLPTGK